ncbi:MAG: amino acid ABC transporter permease [Actinobacteria bacterium]|nr:amino acid ABC transporter permease [Actinomycetota bacterium]MBW3649441.1 amino acid ABC transporter permease [Actinomycetota bacterium]
MTAPVLADALGPRARRRVALASVLAGAVLVLLVVAVVLRLQDTGQLDASRWRPLAEPSTARFLLGGLVNTLKVALIAMGLAILVGGLMALGRLARNGPVRWLSGVYVEFFRAVPLLLLILFSALALPKYGLRLPAFGYLILALVAYNSAVLGEIFRAGILSLERGQTEAALAIGLGYWQSMLFVIIPQAVRRMVPAIVSQLVTLLKDTSLGFVIGLSLQDRELLRRARDLGEFYRNPLQSLVVVAVIYIVINFALSRLARWLEVRQRRRYSAGAISVAGVEDLAVVTAEAGGRMGGS